MPGCNFWTLPYAVIFQHRRVTLINLMIINVLIPSSHACMHTLLICRKSHFRFSKTRKFKDIHLFSVAHIYECIANTHFVVQLVCWGELVSWRYRQQTMKDLPQYSPVGRAQTQMSSIRCPLRYLTSSRSLPEAADPRPRLSYDRPLLCFIWKSSVFVSVAATATTVKLRSGSALVCL